MKLIDKFSKITIQQPTVRLTADEKNSIKGIANEDNWILDRIAQDLSEESVSIVPSIQPDRLIPALRRPMPPLADGAWSKSKLRSQLKKLRSIGLSDDAAINKIIEMGGAGTASESLIFRELARSLYWQTVPVSVLESWLSNRSASKISDGDSEYARFNENRGTPTNDIDGTGKIGEIELVSDIQDKLAAIDGLIFECRSTNVAELPGMISTIKTNIQNTINNDFIKTSSVLDDSIALLESELSTSIILQAQTLPPSIPTNDLSTEPKDDRNLEEVLEDLSHNVDTIKEKIESGEAILHGQDVEPVETDSGASPEPLSPNSNPGAAPVSKIMGTKQAADDDIQETPSNMTPEQLQRAIENKKWLNRMQVDPMRQMPTTGPAVDTGIQPGTLKGLSKADLRKLLEDKFQQGGRDLPHSTPPLTNKPQVAPTFRAPSIVSDPRTMQFIQDQSKDIKQMGLTPEQYLKQKELHTEKLQDKQFRTNVVNEGIQRHIDLLKDILDLTEDDTEKSNLHKQITELRSQIGKDPKGLDSGSSPVSLSKSPEAVVDRQNKSHYDMLIKSLTGRPFIDSDGTSRVTTPEEAAATVNKVKTVDLFNEYLGRTVTPASRGSESNPKAKDPGQVLMEFSPDKGTMSPSYKGGPARSGKDVAWTSVLPPALEQFGISNTESYIRNLPKAYKTVTVKGPDGKPLLVKNENRYKKQKAIDGNGKIIEELIEDPKAPAVVPKTRLEPRGIDYRKLSDNDINAMDYMLSLMQSAYGFNQEQIQKGVRMQNKAPEGVGKPVKSDGKSPIVQKKPSIPKKSVDNEAKEYYHDLYGDYGDKMTKDRVATVVDILDEVLSWHGATASTSDIQQAIDLYGVEYVGSNNIFKLANSDDQLHSILTKIGLNYTIGNGINYATLTQDDLPSITKLAMVGNDSEKLNTYLAAKMKIPVVKGQSDDAVKLNKDEDKAGADDQVLARPAHVPFEIMDSEDEGTYTKLYISWDPKNPAAQMSSTGIGQAIISFIKGLESKKEFVDLGFLGQIQLKDVDIKDGTATAWFATTKHTVPPSVKTI